MAASRQDKRARKAAEDAEFEAAVEAGEWLVSFRQPIEVLGRRIEAIHMQEPEIGHMETAQKKSASISDGSRQTYFAQLLVSMAGDAPLEVVKRMKMSDFVKCVRFVTHFTEPPEELPEEPIQDNAGD